MQFSLNLNLGDVAFKFKNKQYVNTYIRVYLLLNFQLCLHIGHC